MSHPSSSRQRRDSSEIFDVDDPTTFSGSTSIHDLDDRYEEKTFPPSRRESRLRSPSSSPSLARLAWVAAALVAGVVIGHSHVLPKGSAIVGNPFLAAKTKGEDVRSGIWQPVDGVHDLAAMGTKVHRPEGLPECERTMLFVWVRLSHAPFLFFLYLPLTLSVTPSLTFSPLIVELQVGLWQYSNESPSCRLSFSRCLFSSLPSLLTSSSSTQGFFAKAHGYQMLISRDENSYGAFLDHFEPPPMNCWARDEWYDPGRYYQPKFEGETAKVASVMEAMEKGEDADRRVNRILVDLNECVSFSSFLVLLTDSPPS
jgi:hypothetical protein